jgi:peptidoglycan/xylan/chitin deacetylase (PgdA/CDA1 family)
LERSCDGCYVPHTLSRRYLREFGLPAVVLATLYVACADPPKKINKGSGGAPGTAGMSVGDAGEGETAGSNAIGGKGGSGGIADDGAAGEGGAGEGGEAGAVEATGGKGGSGGAAQGGSGGTAPDPCTGLVVGGKSKMPPAPKTNQAKPSGAVGGFKVIDWAGFKAAISYTFDDSLLSQTTHYEALNAVGVPMTFYLVNGNQGSNAIWAKAVADGHELGNHTAHHCRPNGTECINNAVFASQAAELDDNTTFIMMKAGVTGVYTFASPYGDQGWQEEAKKRFFVARGVSDGVNILPNNDAYAFDLPCHISNKLETAVGGFNSITDDLRAKGAWRTILMHNVDPAITDYGYNPVELKEAVAAMTYTKSLPDMWADTVLAVAAYWRGQTKVSAAKPKVVGSDTTYSWTLPDHFPPGMYVRATVNGGKVKQCGTELPWDSHGYYEINLDAGSVTISP